MGKSTHNDVFDPSLNYLVDEADKLVVMDDIGAEDPPTYAQCITAADSGTNHMLAISNITDISATTPEDGDVSGRKITIPEFANITISVTGDATHLALVDSVGEKVLYVSTCTLQALTAANLITIPAWDVELRDPA